jgi:hypothetical protein
VLLAAERCVKEASGANRLLMGWRNLWDSRKLHSSHVLNSEKVFNLFNHDNQLQRPVLSSGLRHRVV